MFSESHISNTGKLLENISRRKIRQYSHFNLKKKLKKYKEK